MSLMSHPLFQLCPEIKARQVAAFSFGTAYQQSVSASFFSCSYKDKLLFLLYIHCILICCM